LPGTEIYRCCIDNGYLNPDFGVDDISYQRMGKSVLKQKDIKLLINLQRFFNIVVHCKWIAPLVMLLIRLPHNRIFDMFFQFPWTKKTIKYAGSFRSKVREVKSLLLVLIGVHQ